MTPINEKIQSIEIRRNKNERKEIKDEDFTPLQEETGKAKIL